jgi:hypothetical protein
MNSDLRYEIQGYIKKLRSYRGVSGGSAGWAIAHPYFGRLEDTAG